MDLNSCRESCCFPQTIHFTIILWFLLSRALHLRFEKGMVGLSLCDFVGTREEKAKMAEYRKQEWPRRYKVLSTKLFLLIDNSTIYPDSQIVVRDSLSERRIRYI